jgi:hypothetical protein
MVGRTSEIPGAGWSRPLDAFSVVHEGWLISLDILSPDRGTQPVSTNDLPLVGVTFEETNAATIMIAAGRSAVPETVDGIAREPRRNAGGRTGNGR